MNPAKVAGAVLFAVVLGAGAVLFLRERTREAGLQEMRHNLDNLGAQQRDLVRQTAQRSAAPQKEAISAPNETGYFQAEIAPASGFRPLALAAGKNRKAQTFYIAPLPDLIGDDFTRCYSSSKGLMVELSERAQARVRAISFERGLGEQGHEALLVDGKLVSVISYWGVVQTNSLLVEGSDSEGHEWTKQFAEEVARGAAGP